MAIGDAREGPRELTVQVGALRRSELRKGLVERGRERGRAVGAVAVTIHGTAAAIELTPYATTGPFTRIQHGEGDRYVSRASGNHNGEARVAEGRRVSSLDLKLARNMLAAMSGVFTSPFTMAVTLR